MVLPISVVVPRTAEGEDLFVQYCLPSIRENDPAEIITELGDGDIAEKRKVGAGKATQPYLIFVDEHIVFYEWAFRKMAQTLDELQDVAFVYCDARRFSGKTSSRQKAQPWDPSTIQSLNYVPIASLMRRELFPREFKMSDPEGKDIWTAMAATGRQGLYIGEVLFEIHDERLPINKPTTA